MSYASLADVRQEMNVDTLPARPDDDREITRALRQVSRRIDVLLKARTPFFEPFIETRYVPIDGDLINSSARTLIIGYPLLSITGVTVNTQALTLDSTVQGFPQYASPFTGLQLLGCDWRTWYSLNCGSCTTAFAHIAGVWGYNVNYANAWLSVDTLSGGIDSAVTTITVTHIDGETIYGDVPRLSAGNLIQIDSEWMRVTATNTVSNTATVIRGQNGSTAASHSNGAAVSVYIVEDQIRRAVAKQVAFQYARKGAYETRRMDGIATIEYPADMPYEVLKLLSYYTNL